MYWVMYVLCVCFLAHDGVHACIYVFVYAVMYLFMDWFTCLVVYVFVIKLLDYVLMYSCLYVFI